MSCKPCFRLRSEIQCSININYEASIQIWISMKFFFTYHEISAGLWWPNLNWNYFWIASITTGAIQIHIFERANGINNSYKFGIPTITCIMFHFRGFQSKFNISLPTKRITRGIGSNDVRSPKCVAIVFSK